ncbi:HAD hydrolase-like protein [Streptomyces bauhiniae]|uniref:HAD hydrolase-like protein n=1 Tax=Streptomyces bauhiniae TaxID=2340725 RepID=UPI001EF2D6E1|nr:HAD hydrolase-like protein [Streptomyces bauhiniae]
MPERGHFEAAASACGVLLSVGGWMVGDNPETDMHGATAAGLRTVGVANGRKWINSPREPDVIVPGIVEAIEVLRRLPTY